MEAVELLRERRGKANGNLDSSGPDVSNMQRQGSAELSRLPMQKGCISCMGHCVG